MVNNKIDSAIKLYMGGAFPARISGTRFHSESNKDGVEMQFECDFSAFKIQTLILSQLVVIQMDEKLKR